MSCESDAQGLGKKKTSAKKKWYTVIREEENFNKKKWYTVIREEENFNKKKVIHSD